VAGLALAVGALVLGIVLTARARQRRAPSSRGGGELPRFLVRAICRTAGEEDRSRAELARWRRRIAQRQHVQIMLRQHLSGSQTLEVGEKARRFEVPPPPAELLEETERLLDRS
jgi:hypothetical protein